MTSQDPKFTSFFLIKAQLCFLLFWTEVEVAEQQMIKFGKPWIQWHKAKRESQTKRHDRCQLSWCGQVLYKHSEKGALRLERLASSTKGGDTQTEPQKGVAPRVGRGNERKTGRWEQLYKAVSLNPGCALESLWDKPGFNLKMI